MTGDVAAPCACRDAREAANDAIRAFVAGRTVWDDDALAHLDQLRQAWREATTRETRRTTTV